MAEKPTRGGEFSSFDDLLLCVICYEPFTNPKMLQCGHTFCEHCLQRCHNASQEERWSRRGNLSCPTCREITSVPENGIAGLRNDFRMNKMDEVLRKTNIHNRASTNLCNPCMSKKMTVVAKVYCINCNINYCDECLRTHSVNSVFKDHTVFDKSAPQNSVSTILTCKIHTDEDSPYFCRTCKTVVCTLCIIEEHGEHDVAKIEVAYKQQQEVANDLKQIICDKAKHKRVVKADFEAVHSSIIRSCEQAESGIKEKASHMIASIEKQKTDLLRELRQRREKKLVPLKKQLDTLNCFIAEAQGLQDFPRSDETNSQVQLLADHDDLIKRMHTMAEDDELTCCEETPLTMTFLAGNQDPIVGRIETVEGSIDILQTPELKEKLQSYDKGLLTFTESDGRVILSGMVDLVARAKIDILRLAESKGSHSDGSTGSSYMLGNATVEVVQGDLTTFHADAIVNAANGQLSHKGGLAKAIVDAGGSEIQRECDDYMRQRDYRNLNPGLVYVSTSGRLPCKKVIHAVGPRWQGGNCSEEKNLYDAIYESLVAAEQCGLSSVALPALSSGNSGFPIDRCTMFITLALSDYLEGHKQTCVKKVFLVDKTDYVLKEFHKSLGIMYGARSKHCADTLHSPTNTYVTKIKVSQPSASARLTDETANEQKCPRGATSHSNIDNNDTSIQIGPLRIQIVQGDLTKEQTGAIVNSSSTCLDLTTGATSRAIVETGGQSIVKECRNIGTIPRNGIVVTQPGKLPCSHIIHIDASKNLKSVIKNVLVEADHLRIESVAFPALGTGNLGLTHCDAANKMLEAIKHFTQSNTVKYLRLVRIVIFEQTMMESFRRCFLEKANISGTTQPVFPSSYRKRPDHGGETATENPPVTQVQWMFADGKTFTSNTEEINRKLEMAYQNKQKTVEWTDSTGRQRFSLEKMKDKIKETSIERRFTFDGVNLPKHWSDMHSTKTCSLFKLDQTKPEYKTVQKNFTKNAGVSAKQIYSINRIQNPKLYQQYVLCREETRKHCRQQNIIEHELWYNTTADAVDDINANGFRASHSDDGIRFTVKPSADTYAPKCVYLACVVTGEYTMSPRGYPGRNDHSRASIDSMVDSVTHPTTYVVPSKHQAYPEYLIMFS